MVVLRWCSASHRSRPSPTKFRNDCLAPVRFYCQFKTKEKNKVSTFSFWAFLAFKFWIVCFTFSTCSKSCPIEKLLSLFLNNQIIFDRIIESLQANLLNNIIKTSPDLVASKICWPWPMTPPPVQFFASGTQLFASLVFLQQAYMKHKIHLYNVSSFSSYTIKTPLDANIPHYWTLKSIDNPISISK